jgi:hypothetical protein
MLGLRPARGRAVLESSDLQTVIADTIAAAAERGRELAGGRA